MSKQLWVICMSLFTVAALAVPTQARADEEACYATGSHVNPTDCKSCCSKLCGACHTDGHYECAAAIIPIG